MQKRLDRVRRIMLLPIVALPFGNSASFAAPPPPGFVEAYHARACMASAAAAPISMNVRSVSANEAGVHVNGSGPATFAWAIDLALPSDVHPIGLTVAFDQGTLLLTDDGRWIRIAKPKMAIAGVDAEAVPIADSTRPKAVTTDLDGTVASIQADGATVARYDLAACGFGAKAQAAFHLVTGAQADVVAEVGPNLGGFAQNPYILVGGKQGDQPGQMAFWPVDGNVARPFGDPFVAIPAKSRLSLLAEFDIAGGCNAVFGATASNGTTKLITFCKPGFEDHTTLLAGDVGLPVARTPAAVRKAITLATFSVPVIAATPEPWVKDGHSILLVLTKSPSGISRIIALSAKAAGYPIQH